MVSRRGNLHNEYVLVCPNASVNEVGPASGAALARSFVLICAAVCISYSRKACVLPTQSRQILSLRGIDVGLIER